MNGVQAGKAATAPGGADAESAQIQEKATLQQQRAALRRASSWGYQLRQVQPAAIAASPQDLVVVDYAPMPPTGSPESPFPREVVQAMKRKPDGSRRLLLAYLSIGEAEDYRLYWNGAWNLPDSRPGWIGEANPQWVGNYPVRFWDPQWHSLILGSDGYLSRILAAGYDGVYLDRADVYELWRHERPDARDRMVELITGLARQARKTDPAFLIVMQNAEELLTVSLLRRSIDGIAKEDLSFGAGTPEEANPRSMQQGSLALLRLARRSGLKVLVVEYVSDAAKASSARRLAEREGFVIHFAERSLATIQPGDPDRTASPASHMAAPTALPSPNAAQ